MAVPSKIRVRLGIYEMLSLSRLTYAVVKVLC